MRFAPLRVSSSFPGAPQITALFTFIPIHDESAPLEKQCLFMIKDSADAMADQLPDKIGKAAHDVCIRMAAGYVMARLYKDACRIGTDKAAPCALSALPEATFVRGVDSVTSLISTKNSSVRTHIDSAKGNNSNPKTRALRLVGAVCVAVPMSTALTALW